MELTFKILYFLYLTCQMAVAQSNLALLNLATALGGFDFGGEGMTIPGMSAMPGTTADSASCPYQAHPNRLKFTQIVNDRVMTQDCAPGTMFVLSKCSCDNLPPAGTNNVNGNTLPGSNPRHDAYVPGSGSAGNPFMSILQGGTGFQGSTAEALMAQLLGMGSGQSPIPTTGIRPVQTPVESQSGQNDRRQQTDSLGGVTDTQSAVGILHNAPKSTLTSTVEYKPQPLSGLTPVGDPSALSAMLPPEVFRMLTTDNASIIRNPDIVSQKQSLSLQSQIVSSQTDPYTPHKQMTTGQAQPPQTFTSSQESNSVSTANLPPDVLQMLQRSMYPPRQRNSQLMLAQTRSSGTGPTSMQISGGQQQDLLGAWRAQSDNHSRLTNGNLPPNPQGSSRPDPLAALLAGLLSQRSSASSASHVPGNRGAVDPNVDSLVPLLMRLRNGGSPVGGGSSVPSMLGGPSSATNPRTSGGRFDTSSLVGNGNIATAFGDAQGAGLPPTADMTNHFNMQGSLGAGRLLEGLNNMSQMQMLRLQQLDRQGVIDLSDLSPAGLAAAHAHFNG